ncbi:transposase InsO family protein [Alkalibacillus filiformis]|uniref:Transposase InsO family protein n=1 Tax=Alkalibacillus filiformis TaxID=200990 RepID=A0ABU0DX85_9BACI|nr:IS3 family transposase [Alkalibacillus filiformis]MDQ0353093.1 transposase InsO family protein [Alkalibacillus filiformis]
MKYEFIDQHRNEHTVLKMCVVLGVSKSGFYEYKKRKNNSETERKKHERLLREAIRVSFYESKEVYGSPRVHADLVAQGFTVSIKTVANYMRDMGLQAKQPKRSRSTTQSNHHYKTYKNHINQDFKVESPNEIWTTDITYIPTLEGFVFLNVIIDLYSRRVISYRVDDHMKVNLTTEALQDAMNNRQPEPGLIHHSDRGSQYCAHAYTEILLNQEAIISMSRKGNPYDNACAESFFGSMKTEMPTLIFGSKVDAIDEVHDYIVFYNRRRRHSALDYMTPEEYEWAN